MRFVCDVHISVKINSTLSSLGHHSEHINNILNGSSTTDGNISEYVDENNCILATKDKDFKHSFILNHKPKKLVKINLRNFDNTRLLDAIFLS